LAPDSGSVRINGVDLAHNPRLAKSGLGYLPDQSVFYPEMTVIAYLHFCARLRGLCGEGLDIQLSIVVEELGLAGVLSHRIDHLSRGFRQRVALAQALVHRPKVLVLDEPTEGLDPAQVSQLRSLIRSFAGLTTVLLSSHILCEVEAICDRAIIIDSGKVSDSVFFDAKRVTPENKYTYKLSYLGDSSIVVSSISKISGLFILRHEPDAHPVSEICFSVESADVLTEVMKHLSMLGADFRELKRCDTSLEEVFFNATSRGGVN